MYSGTEDSFVTPFEIVSMRTYPPSVCASC